MDRSNLEIVRKTLTHSRDVADLTLRDDRLHSVIVEIASRWVLSLRAGGKILLCGNGGSAGDAQHIAGELVSRFLFDRAPLAGLALTVDTSVLTAIGNDYGYEHTFSRQVKALGRAGDVLVGISTSGRSPNIVAALRAAQEIGLITIGLTGSSSGPMCEHCDLVFHAPSMSTPLIQQIHITVGHIICEIVEQVMFGGSGNAA
jgi:D-sedoheptulose 7-phosphate isomerase